MEDQQTIVRVRCGLGWVAAALMGLGLVGAAGGGLSGCSTSSRFTPSGNPLLDVRNPELLARDRVAAARAAWAEVESGVRNRERTREAFKSLAWSNSTEQPVRLTLVELLMSDETPEGAADSLSMARLMLPTERSGAVTRLLALTAAERGWDETLGPLVRAYARVMPGVEDASRPERAAIAALRPDVSVEDTVYGVFLRPSAGGDASGVTGSVLQTDERTRDDAWTLLSRLDLDGRVRARLIGDETPTDADAGSAADVRTLRAGLGELGSLPATGAELAWLRRLHRHEDAAIRATNAAWWSEAAAAIARLTPDQRRGLELRHAEPVRWAAAERPAWLGMTREALLGELAGRLDQRPRQTRDAPRGQRPRSERLRDWAERMSFGDALAVLVVDETLADASVNRTLFEQVELDRRDESTEYGGVLDRADGDRGASYRMVLFRPRARDRISDDRFVASGDMIRFSDRALAHYHLQVQNARMSRAAGPSDGDLLYAAESGRTCLVFTSIGKGTLNADLYTPDGQIIDLGYVERR